MQQLQEELDMAQPSDGNKAHQSPPVEEKHSQVKVRLTWTMYFLFLLNSSVVVYC